MGKTVAATCCAALIVGCTQYQTVNLNGSMCDASPAELKRQGFERVSAIPQAGGQGAGRGSQRLSVTCPDGTVITMSQDIEGQGSGQVSP